ncbi:uncharacterized LabA/DUF88 family protein [Luteibacter sp. 621]|jgi:uncharacterized LabA/DUF88 family protein|uniref:NYN domain-containing protein n=1 Tax=Luteibacter sp. 621 TaxID=3373916 RepID=UPI003D19B3CE
MLSYAIMLDGGFVKRKARAAKQAAASQDVVRLTLAIRAHPLLGPHRLHRIYFYDAAPSREVVHNPFSRESIDFGATAAFRENLTLHKKLACEAFFANRLGELSFEGWAPKGGLRKVKDGNVVLTGRDVKPLISQKGVDMRIGLDMASLTLKRLSSLIVLVTSDSDFVPAMKFARREGAQVLLITLGHGVKESMRMHADVVIDSSVDEWLEAAGLI